MSADYSRIHRLLKILMLIQSGGTWTAERLAAECDVAVRTIYRDLKTLEGAGVPYFFDGEQKGYRVRRDFFMPPVELTLDESLALLALGEHVAGREQVPMTRAAERAIAKVRSQLPTAVQQEVEQLDGRVAIDLAAAGPHDGIADVYEQVRSAIADRRMLRCSYESIQSSLDGGTGGGGSGGAGGGGGDEVFEFRPYALLFAQRAWYAVGHHGGRGAVRQLKLNRFTAVERTGKPYEIPADFSLADHHGQAWRMIRGEPRCDVELHFDAAFAETVADTRWHSTQQVDWHDDGSITFRCQVDGLDEIVWWVLSMGPHCVVKQPVELADRVRSLAEAVVAKYAAVQQE
ncbi:helix-turn-helix transcriptional regulator [Phycisphaerales bacterium AB-hyl4]|uniref:Helix-turn-helix transcriptional regulator n=1 Tax=Natronomicrosphaera hydrolytica TaxID=3242702 RepID=A0ABV4UAB1_9BACT